MTIPLSITQHQYKDIVKWYTRLAKDYRGIARFVRSIGKSVQGRRMPAFHITNAKGSPKTIYFQCQIHASERLACLNSYRS